MGVYDCGKGELREGFQLQAVRCLVSASAAGNGLATIGSEELKAEGEG